MKRLVATGTSIAVATLLLASSGGTHAVKEGGTFRVGMAAGILTGSIDPATRRVFARSGSSSSNATCRHARERRRLVRFQPPRACSLVPGGRRGLPRHLAATAGRTRSRSGSGFRFSTGAPGSAARDVAAWLNRVLNPALKAPPGYQELFLGSRRCAAAVRERPGDDRVGSCRFERGAARSSG